MKTITKILKSFLKPRNIDLSSEGQWQAEKLDCTNLQLSNAYCDTEKPFIPNYFINN